MLTLKIFSLPFSSSLARHDAYGADIEAERTRFTTDGAGWVFEVRNREPNEHGDRWSFLEISRQISHIEDVPRYWDTKLLDYPKQGVEVEFQNALLPDTRKRADESPFLDCDASSSYDSADLPATFHFRPDISKKTLVVGVWGGEAEGDYEKFWRLLWMVERKTRIAKKLHQLRIMVEPRNLGAVERLHREVLELVASFRW